MRQCWLHVVFGCRLVAVVFLQLYSCNGGACVCIWWWSLYVMVVAVVSFLAKSLVKQLK